MAIAKAARKNPREVAQEVAEAVDLAPMAGKPEVAGPGFLNVRLRDDWIVAAARRPAGRRPLGLNPPEKPKTVVIDYSSPNVAKPMHVGHLRSTVIGESLARIFRALGHKVIRDNHLGDWGSQFGMILWGWKNHRDEAAYAADPVAELARLYRLAQARIKPGESLREQYGKAIALDEQGKAAEAAALFAKLAEGTTDTFEDVARKVAEARDVADATRAETVKLHAGDFENRRPLGAVHAPLPGRAPGRLRPARHPPRRPPRREFLRPDARRGGPGPRKPRAWPSRARGRPSSSPRGSRPRSSSARATGRSTTPRPTWPRSSTGKADLESRPPPLRRRPPPGRPLQAALRRGQTLGI